MSSGALTAATEPAARLRVLAHPARLAINRALQSRAGEPATAADVARSVVLPVPTARRHLAVLADAGLVSVDRSTRPSRFTPVLAVSRELAHSVHSALAAEDRVEGEPAGAAGGQHLQLLSRVAAQVADGVALIDPDGWLIYANPAFRAMHGHDEELAGWHFTAFVPATGQEETLRQLITDAREHGVGRADVWRLRRDGSVFPAAVTLSLLRDDAGRALGRVLSVQDATERRALEDQLRSQALRDPLTGLANRRLLLDRLEQALADASAADQPVAVLFCDLDGFKQVNDRHGHDVGDQLLVQVAARLSAQLRPCDTVARLGGDEFVAVLPSTDLAGGHEVASRLRVAIAPPVHLAGTQLSVGLSIGVATDSAGTAGRLLAGADAAMYRDKTARRSPTRFCQGAVVPLPRDGAAPAVRGGSASG